MSLSAFELNNEIALITGGAAGIGYAIAKCMVEAGAKVILADLNKELLDQAVSELGTNAFGKVYDVSEYNNAQTFIKRINNKIGPVSILVNNAGNQIIKPALDLTEEDFMKVHNVHVMGAYSLSRAVAPDMLSNGKGSIIFISSESALIGLPKVAAYSAAKAAYLGLVRSFASEWSEYGVRINAIIPGWTETEILKKLFREAPERKKKVLERTPMKCFGKPEDIGYATVYLCSSAGRFVTGTSLLVDGGVSIGF